MKKGKKEQSYLSLLRYASVYSIFYFCSLLFFGECIFILNDYNLNYNCNNNQNK